MRVPSYRLHKPSGRAVVTVDGRDFYLGKFQTEESHAEYRRVIAEYLNGSSATRAVSKAQPAREVPTIESILTAYQRHVDVRYADRSSAEPRNIDLAMRAVLALYGHVAATDFGPKALKTVRHNMVASDLCRNEVNKRIKRIVAAFKWAVSEELIPVGIHQALKTVPGLKRGEGVRESKRVTPVPEAHVDAIKPYVSRIIWAMISLQRTTGMRPGELCQMRTCDLNMICTIWDYVPMSHKTECHGHKRNILLGPKAQEILRPWLRLGLTEFLFQPKEAEAERRTAQHQSRKTKVQPSQMNRSMAHPRKVPGARYYPGSYCQAVKRGCRKAGVPSWHPHQLRHNYATMIRREYGLDVAQYLLGHASVVATQIYAEVHGDRAREAIAVIG